MHAAAQRDRPVPTNPAPGEHPSFFPNPHTFISASSISPSPSVMLFIMEMSKPGREKDVSVFMNEFHEAHSPA